MEKHVPHYDLATIKADVARLGAAAFTRSALDGGRKLGLSTRAMIRVILSMERAQFYKSMTTHGDHRVWQDVYHPAAPDGTALYVKVTYRGPERPPVISFKEK
ncbi:type II toxin-antitoxin system MqsR family toxin [Metapseudomonas furukawaii]|jgi:motility quorum-sensing regulator/GCU-specific mRNA interferase toxin|uniref:Motility quorum-sensing regulator MqsR n=1 Tax=Metapseudomonas furukawaii TaxID=1149133 RepID=A0AAD1FF83_METFU|nr:MULTISPECIES: type II toxin-antitoxin system MqsR family toxin [Pseudomonas]OWJ89670.1 motility quorum-sensing regulator MqsR [Pseudomonas sp. A46]BAU74620.1 hypothetical protein KF707C_29320 [Pseudomonas furukawaii]